MRISAKDYFSLPTSRRVTDEGFVVTTGTMARTGIQEYRRFELGLDGDPMGVVRLYRPPEEVFAPDSLATFELKPITIDHPPEGVTSANWKDFARGDVRGVKRAGDMMEGELTFRSKDAIDALDNGKSQLSNGYTFEPDMTPGVVPAGQYDAGKAYDGVQRKIVGNHVALVDSARCGSACRVGDSAPSTPGATTMTTQKITVDGIPLEVSDTAAAVLLKLQTANTDLTKSLTMANDAMKIMVSKEVHDKALADIEALKKDVMTPAARDAMVADWAGLLVSAKRLMPALVSDGKTCHAIRKEVLASVMVDGSNAKNVGAAVLAGVTLDAASEDAVRTTYNAVAAATPVQDAGTFGNDSVVAAALLGQVTTTPVAAADGKPPALTGRAKMMAASAAAYKS